MNELEFSFEESPWDAYRLTKQMGDKISAAHLLAMLEAEDDRYWTMLWRILKPDA